MEKLIIAATLNFGHVAAGLLAFTALALEAAVGSVVFGLGEDCSFNIGLSKSYDLLVF